MNQDVKDRVLRVERLIAAKPERVFELWTDPEQLVQWWGPEGYTTPTQTIDVRPGGRWRTTMRSPEGNDFTVSGIYRSIEPPRRLVFTWGWDDENGVRGHETEITVTFEAAPGGTRMVLTQQTFADKDSRGRHEQGWNSSFVCLAQIAERVRAKR